MHHQVVVTMMELPPGCRGTHDAEFYTATLRKILDSGLPFDSVCFKDASGTSNPKKVFDTVKSARQLVGQDVILWVHTHETAAQGVAQYTAAIEAGCDGICVARAPVSGGTSQPDMISMWHALKGTEYSLDIDVNKILEANAVFKECLEDYYFPPEAMRVSSEVLLSPMPGGALTANTMMMRDTGTLHLYPQVIEAMSECVAKGGYGTSVTPVSQFYFQQAYANVVHGRWKKITNGYGNMVLGYFGRTPVEPDPQIVKIAEEQMGKPRFEGDPLDILEPGIPKAKEILEKEGLPVNDENLFIVGALATPGGNKGLDFLKGNYSINVRKLSKELKNKQTQETQQPSGGLEEFVVTVNGKDYNVTVREGSSEVQSVKEVYNAPKSPSNVPGNLIEVTANLPGNVYKIAVSEGDQVDENDTLVVLEAMKMETPLASPSPGKVSSIDVKLGDVVEAGQLILTIEI